MLFPNIKTFFVYALGVGLVDFSYGRFLGTMPSITADFYGTENIGLNYAWIYTAWGGAGIYGPMIGVLLKGNWVKSFYILGIVCIANINFLSIAKAPVKAKN